MLFGETEGAHFFPGFANSFLKQICQLTKTHTHNRKFPIFTVAEAGFFLLVSDRTFSSSLSIH